MLFRWLVITLNWWHRHWLVVDFIQDIVLCVLTVKRLESKWLLNSFINVCITLVYLSLFFFYFDNCLGFLQSLPVRAVAQIFLMIFLTGPTRTSMSSKFSITSSSVQTSIFYMNLPFWSVVITLTRITTN